MAKKIFRRIETREQFESEPYWQKGYEFVAGEISDITVCEPVGKDKIGRIHLRTCLEPVN